MQQPRRLLVMESQCQRNIDRGMLISDNAVREERGCLAALEIRITCRPYKIQFSRSRTLEVKIKSPNFLMTHHHSFQISSTAYSTGRTSSLTHDPLFLVVELDILWEGVKVGVSSSL